MVKGLAAEREFTAIGRDRRLRVRPPDLEQGIEQLSRVAAGTIDTITLNMVMRRWARAEARQGDLDRARAVLDEMVATFRDKGINPVVLGQIRKQAETTAQALSREA